MTDSCDGPALMSALAGQEVAPLVWRPVSPKSRWWSIGSPTAAFFDRHAWCISNGKTGTVVYYPRGHTVRAKLEFKGDLPTMRCITEQLLAEAWLDWDE